MIVEIKHGAIVIDGGGTNDGVIHLELADELDGRFSRYAAVALAQHPAREDDIDSLPWHEDCRDVDVVVMTRSPL